MILIENEEKPEKPEFRQIINFLLYWDACKIITIENYISIGGINQTDLFDFVFVSDRLACFSSCSTGEESTNYNDRLMNKNMNVRDVIYLDAGVSDNCVVFQL